MSTADWVTQIGRLNYFASQLAHRADSADACDSVRQLANALEHQVYANDDLALARQSTQNLSGTQKGPAQQRSALPDSSQSMMTPPFSYGWISPRAQTPARGTGMHFSARQTSPSPDLIQLSFASPQPSQDASGAASPARSLTEPSPSCHILAPYTLSNPPPDFYPAQHLWPSRAQGAERPRRPSAAKVRPVMQPPSGA